MTTVTVYVRSALALVISAASLVFGLAGTAHAHGTHVTPIELQLPSTSAHHGPFSVLHQGLVPGPFSVLREAR